MSVEQTIIQNTEPIRKFQQDFKRSVTSNFTILIVACAVCIGFATRDMISNVMNESVLPVLTYLALKSIPYLFYNKALQFSKRYEILTLLLRKLGTLIWIILVWIFTLYMTYIVFRSIANVDLVTGRVDLVQGVTKYVLGENVRGENVRGET